MFDEVRRERPHQSQRRSWREPRGWRGFWTDRTGGEMPGLSGQQEACSPGSEHGHRGPSRPAPQPPPPPTDLSEDLGS